MRANESSLREPDDLSAPGEPGSLISRDRLQSRLGSALSKRITVLCAPAGFGKSVAVKRALEQCTTSAVLYNLSPSDTSEAALARGLAEALSQLAPGLRSSYATAVEYASQSVKPHEKLALWFERHLEDIPATVLLEDVHLAGAGTNACRLLESLIDATPHIQWILTTRTPLDLPMDRWRTAGIAGEPVGAEDLRLTQLEAHELAHRREFPPHFVQTLFDETLGWPLAFHIGTSLPEHMHELARLRPRTPEDAYAFLVRRLFERYDDELQDVLLHTSVFSSIDRELVHAGPWAQHWTRLAELAQEGLLVSALSKGELRYHDLFRSFLQDELRARGAWQSSLRTGAAVLEHSDRIPDALRLYVQAGEYDDVLRLCERHGFELMETGRRDDVSAALAVIGETHGESAVVLALRGMNESLLGRSDTAESWFLHGIQKASALHVRAQIAYHYALDLIRQGRMDAIALLEPYADLDGEPPTLRALIQSTLATAYVLAGRFTEAQQAMHRALALASANHPTSLRAKIRHQVAWVALFTGEIEAAKTHAGIAVDLALECGMYDTAARAYSIFYNIAYDVEDDPKGAMRLLDSVLDCGLKAGSPQLRLFALLCMLDIAAELGDHDEAQRIAQTLTAHEVDFSNATASETLLPAQALRTAGQGDFAEAYRLIVASGARQITPDRRALRFSEIALYAASARMRQAAEDALKEVLGTLDSLEPAARRTVRTRLNCVLALRLLGNAAEAAAIAQPATAGANGRLDALSAAVDAILRRWDGDLNYGEVARALEALHENHFGGISNVLAALPNAPPKHAAMGAQ